MQDQKTKSTCKYKIQAPHLYLFESGTWDGQSDAAGAYCFHNLYLSWLIISTKNILKWGFVKNIGTIDILHVVFDF